ncbi:type II secretion system F family protein [Solirubrobacter soli]|uniref:type II secretion system F family protein n=1 Tax=Solirubrobacter soli TaxID=363832 RepID=UPI000423A639|nr:type II secretion system F family protein [Solirubrobacter soli]
MSSAGWALVVLAASGAVGLVGLWQLLAGTSRSAELAARGQAGMGEGTGRSLIRTLDVRFRRTATGRRLAAWLAGAGVALSPVELIGLVTGAALVSWAVLLLLFAGWLAFVVAVGGTILVTRALIGRRRARRSEAFIEQLPEIGRMLANGAQAGLSMPQAVAMASRELADPGAAELKRVVEELRLGQSIENALEGLRQRLPSREVSVLLTTIVIQQRAGGDTVRALGELAATLEARKDLRREVTTLLSGVVFTSYVVAAIGGGTILLLNVMSPGVTKAMTSSAIGIAGLAVTAVLWTVAFTLIRRTTRIDV